MYFLIIKENNNPKSELLSLTLKLSKMLNIPYSDFKDRKLNSGRLESKVVIKSGIQVPLLITKLKNLGFVQNHKLSHRYSLTDAQYYLDNTNTYLVLYEKSNEIEMIITTKY